MGKKRKKKKTLTKMKITIIGNGYVGKATELALEGGHLISDVFVYDKVLKKSRCSFEDALKGDLFFICVPTPMMANGSCDTSIVEEIVNTLKLHKVSPHKIIIRSTVPVGLSGSLEVNFMPEFLTETNWEEDVKNNQDWIVGLPEDNYNLRTSLPRILRGKIHFCPTQEAELVKYVRNGFLATKVSFFNEIESFCSAKGINYEHVKGLTIIDPRINASHTSVPGPDGKKGFGGTCFPKDLHSLSFQMRKLLTPHLIKAVIYRNELIDRPEKDWEKDVGRAVSGTSKA